MTWAPFVGMFVARISKGRTIRELIGGALIVPTLITFLWISVFGGAALKVEQDARVAHQEQVTAAQEAKQTPPADFSGGPILEATKADTTRALFTLFDNLDTGMFGKLLSVLACLLLGTYFITSADSGTLVLCTSMPLGTVSLLPLYAYCGDHDRSHCGSTSIRRRVKSNANGLHYCRFPYRHFYRSDELNAVS